MKGFSYFAMSVLCITLLSVRSSGAGKEYFSKYDVLEVSDFENIEAVDEDSGIRPPQVVLDAVKRDILQHVSELHLFRRINDHEDGKAKSTGSGTLALNGVVESFDSNVHKGGGKGTLKLKIKIINKETEELLFEAPVAAKISAWVNKPHAQVTASEIGKHIAKIIKENW